MNDMKNFSNIWISVSRKIIGTSVNNRLLFLPKWWQLMELTRGFSLPFPMVSTTPCAVTPGLLHSCIFSPWPLQSFELAALNLMHIQAFQLGAHQGWPSDFTNGETEAITCLGRGWTRCWSSDCSEIPLSAIALFHFSIFISRRWNSWTFSPVR